MEVITHKCPNCGGALTFDPKDQKFHCPYCLSIFTEEQVTEYEKKQTEARTLEDTPQEPSPTGNTFSSDEQLATMSEEEKRARADAGLTEQESLSDSAETDIELFLCPNCGAEIATDKTTAATYCYYCHNPVVLSGRLSGNFLPENVLPFAIEKEEAIDRFLSWTRKKWFIPRDFFNKTQIDKLTGVYFPYWTVDSDLIGELNGTGTRIRIWRVGEIEYTETKQFAVRRKGKLSFKELVKNALSKNTQQKMVEGVQPFPIDKAISFKSQYLSGFQAEKRDIEFDLLKNELGRELQEYSEAMLRDTASGYTSLMNVHTSATIENEEARYMLLPVWLVTYRSSASSKKVYYYAMNGQTGKVSGILPISYSRLGFAAAGLFLLLSGLFLLGGYFI